MPIPFLDFKKQHDQLFCAQLMTRFSKILQENSYIEGEWNKSFEEKFAALHGAKYCLLTANGTDALEISLKALGIVPGDFVALPAISFFASVEAIFNIGALPVFFDIDEQTGLTNPKSLAKILEKFEVKAVMPVHIYGLPAPMEEIQGLCDQKKIPIVEDAAQAEGALLPAGPVGCGPNLATFSFYPTKNLGAMGDAGCILTQDEEMASKIKSLRNHGRSEKGHLFSGRNSRCDHFQAAVLDLKLEKQREFNNARKKTAQSYHRALHKLPIQLIPESFIQRSSWHLYPIKLESCGEREQLQKALADKGISTAPFYEKALPDELPCQSAPGEWHNAKSFAGHILCLPMHPFVTDRDIDDVSQGIARFFN